MVAGGPPLGNLRDTKVHTDNVLPGYHRFRRDRTCQNEETCFGSFNEVSIIMRCELYTAQLGVDAVFLVIWFWIGVLCYIDAELSGVKFTPQIMLLPHLSNLI